MVSFGFVPQTGLPGFYLRKKETRHAGGRAVLCWARIWLSVYGLHCTCPLHVFMMVFWFGWFTCAVWGLCWYYFFFVLLLAGWALTTAAPRPDTTASCSRQRPRFGRPAAPRGQGSGGFEGRVRPWPRMRVGKISREEIMNGMECWRADFTQGLPSSRR